MSEITPSLLALQLVTGIALGAVYALLAIGLSLIFGMLTHLLLNARRAAPGTKATPAPESVR